MNTLSDYMLYSALVKIFIAWLVLSLVLEFFFVPIGALIKAGFRSQTRPRWNRRTGRYNPY